MPGVSRAFCIVVVLLSTTTPVAADILVVTEGVSVEDAGALRRAVGAELGTRVLPLATARRELRRRASELGPDPAVGRRDAALAAARRGYVHLNLSASRRAYDAALDAELSRRTAAEARRVARILFERALIELAQRRDAEAQMDLVRAVTLDPELAPDPDEYGPPVFRALERARREAGARPARRLTVERVPADARVFVDGTALVDEGVEVRGAGPYLVVAHRAGYSPRAFWSEGDATITVGLRPAPSGVLAEQALALWDRGHPAEEDLPVVARGIGADRYVVVRRDGVELDASLRSADPAREGAVERNARGRRVTWEPRPYFALAAALAGRVLEPPAPSSVALSVSAPDSVPLGESFTLRAELIDGQRRARRLLADCDGDLTAMGVSDATEHDLEVPAPSETTTLACRLLAVDGVGRVLARVPQGEPLSIAVVDEAVGAPWYGRWYVWLSVGAAVAAGAVLTAILLSGDDDGRRQYVIEGPNP